MLTQVLHPTQFEYGTALKAYAQAMDLFRADAALIPEPDQSLPADSPEWVQWGERIMQLEAIHSLDSYRHALRFTENALIEAGFAHVRTLDEAQPEIATIAALYEGRNRLPVRARILDTFMRMSF